MSNPAGTDASYYVGSPLTSGSVGPDLPIWFTHPVNAAVIAVDPNSAAILTRAGYVPYSVAPQNYR
jgi:hypothetical protein